ncbi:hypothetical protein AS034_00085 [[Bacillus] enclensis]|uniref:Uncharacterized protein n=1 Tax=[Bacillus] enclensis TaxID=1402860 RepID=A0A0V8HNZ7_9BACI|nr:hypothetical protein AS034_00085 [[Bacillus] enclensis]SCB71914.1 hypothetical protein GA0061094_0017 [[Bacillus] enclensis]
MRINGPAALQQLIGVARRRLLTEKWKGFEERLMTSASKPWNWTGFAARMPGGSRSPAESEVLHGNQMRCTEG